jgi:acetyl-CoA carboxylase biotin carboxyl carrier protein
MKDVRARMTPAKSREETRSDIAPIIRELAELLSETDLTEIEIEQNGQRIRVSRQSAPVMVHNGAPVAAASAGPSNPGTASAEQSGPPAGGVPSPMVGTVYVAPEPGKPPFVKVGDSVKEGDTLLIVEAMKTMNPIVAPRAGTITQICITDAEPVEFGQTLLIIG